MMFLEVDASGYDHSGKYYRDTFQEILSGIIACYHLVRSSNIRLPNNENYIRDHMLKQYLKTQWFKTQHGLVNYLFDLEIPEDAGRVDIRIIPVNPLISDDAYYVIECKRIDVKKPTGKSGLNAKYILEGMCRFVSEKYSAHYKTNGMIGFVVQPLDIHVNVASINHLLQTTFKEANTIQVLEYHEIVKDFEFSYRSIHTIGKESITLYHLMLDFSQNIQ